MNIQQGIVVIILTAIISIMAGIMLPGDQDPILKMFSFITIMFIWSFLVVTIDLYLTLKAIKHDLNTYAKCNTN
jgi:hypothetical protein